MTAICPFPCAPAGPITKEGSATLTLAQLSMLPEGIDWVRCFNW